MTDKSRKKIKRIEKKIEKMQAKIEKIKGAAKKKSGAGKAASKTRRPPKEKTASPAKPKLIAAERAPTKVQPVPSAATAA